MATTDHDSIDQAAKITLGHEVERLTIDDIRDSVHSQIVHCQTLSVS